MTFSRLLLITVRGLAVAAAVLSIWASVNIWTSPITAQVVSTSQQAGEPEVTESYTETYTWFEYSGWWGTFLLVLAASLGLAGAAAALMGNERILAGIALLMIFGVTISGFSIGGAYLTPAVIILLAALALSLYRRIQHLQRSGDELE